MSYGPINDNIGNNGTVPQKLPPKTENVRKADIVVTFISKEYNKETQELDTRVRGIKTTVFGYIDYIGNYNCQYTVKDVLKRIEGVMNPFDKSFDIGFIKLPMNDCHYKFIPKPNIISIDMEVFDFDEEVDNEKANSRSSNFNYGH